MKVISSFLFGILCSYSATSVVVSSEVSTPEVRITPERSSEKNRPQNTGGEQLQKKRKIQDEPDIPSLIDINEIYKRLEYKSDVLNQTLPRAVKALEQIHRELQQKALSYKSQNFEHATELARIGGEIKSLSSSIAIILKNLESKDYHNNKTLINTSLAVSGSGALLPLLRSITQTLSKTHDTREINCDALEDTARKIYEVTQDIQVEDFELSDEYS